MLQILYVSSMRRGQTIDLDALLDQCRQNNGRTGVTGMLFTDGKRFLQAIEGPRVAVEAVFDRIAADPRHHAIVTLSRRDIAAREFGDWAMARRGTAETHDAFARRAAALCDAADPSVQGTFAGMIDARRAA